MRRFAILVVTAMVWGCSVSGGTGSPAPSEPLAPSPVASWEPSTSAPATSRTQVPTAAPVTAAPSDMPKPLPTPSLTIVRGDLVARIVAYPDVYVAPVPADLSVYSDGSVVSAGWRTGTPDTVLYSVRTLSPSGLRAVRSAFEAAVPHAGQIGSEPQGGAGYTTYVVTVRRAAGVGVAWTTSSSGGAAARALVAFAERWAQPERQLPGSAWTRTEALPFSSGQWALVLDVSRDRRPEPSAPPDGPIVRLLGPLESFGDPVPGMPSTTRCGTLDWESWPALAAALAAAGVRVDRYGSLWATMSHDSVGETQLQLVPLLPDTLDACGYVFKDPVPGP
ncbi:MAG TPA: hypothetical protein VIR16_00855 [Candidatus Limnocylindrales bacterium]